MRATAERDEWKTQINSKCSVADISTFWIFIHLFSHSQSNFNWFDSNSWNARNTIFSMNSNVSFRPRWGSSATSSICGAARFHFWCSAIRIGAYICPAWPLRAATVVWTPFLRVDCERETIDKFRTTKLRYVDVGISPQPNDHGDARSVPLEMQWSNEIRNRRMRLYNLFRAKAKQNDRENVIFDE